MVCDVAFHQWKRFWTFRILALYKYFIIIINERCYVWHHLTLSIQLSCVLILVVYLSSAWIKPSVWPFNWKPVLSCGTVYYVVQGGSNFLVCEWNPSVWPFKWKLLSRTFMWYCLLCCTRWFWVFSLWIQPKCETIQVQAVEQYFHVALFMLLYKVVLTFKSVNETPVFGCHPAVLSCDTVYYVGYTRHKVAPAF